MSTTAARARRNPEQDAPRQPDHGIDAATLVSWDVFDTVVTRAVGQPNSLFLLLGRRLRSRGLLPLDANAFAAARRSADGRAKHNQGHGWDLAGIYRELQYTLGLDDATRDAIMAEELTLERELLRVVPGAPERIARLRDAGVRVAFLSDMYLGPDFIRATLAEHGLCADGDACYVSSETGVRKEDGRAFRALMEREGVAPDRIVHLGNHLAHDVLAAQRLGMRGVYRPDANPNRYELRLEAWTAATEGLASVMAGASRLARLSVPAATPRLAAQRDVAAGVGGPLIVSYVLWVLLDARRHGIERLYFLSRDGWILLKVAERLAARLGIDIELRYLHGGGRAWGPAAVEGVEPPDFFWAIHHGLGDATVKSFMRRVGLDADDFAEELESLGHARPEWNTPCEEDSFWAILEHPAVRDRLLAEAARQRAEVLAYSRQEGLLDDVQWALVDVGWSGRVVGALHRILLSQGRKVPAAYFVSRLIDHVTQNVQTGVDIRSWFSDHTRGVGYLQLVRELYIEFFCGAEHGAVVGYDVGDAAVTPRFDGDGHPALREWGLPIVHQTIIAFAEQLWLDEEAVGIHGNMRPAVADALIEFVRRPTKQEAAAWGAYPFEYGRTGTRISTIAAPYQFRDIGRALWRGKVVDGRKSQWDEASLALTTAPLRFTIRAVLAVRRRLADRIRPVRARLLPRRT
jgi:FMN phosphatase YigB (HAD superfamily)